MVPWHPLFTILRLRVKPIVILSALSNKRFILLIVSGSEGVFFRVAKSWASEAWAAFIEEVWLDSCWWATWFWGTGAAPCSVGWVGWGRAGTACWTEAETALEVVVRAEAAAWGVVARAAGAAACWWRTWEARGLGREVTTSKYQKTNISPLIGSSSNFKLKMRRGLS